MRSKFTEAFDRILAVSQKVNLDARQELESLCQEGKRVGRKYSSALMMCKAAAIKLSSVEKHPDLQNIWVVKHKSSSVKSSSVDVKAAIKWKGKTLHILACTCSYFTSSWQLCPCCCAVVQCVGLDIDDPAMVHPYWLVSNHPL